jgi:carbon-monoxide dehydrogenase small subunit
MKPELVALDVNGDVRYVPITGLQSLADVLRQEVHLTCVKVGCAEGYCGSCTVLLDGEPVVSCLMPAIACEGRQVRTVDEPGELSGLQADLQRELCESDAVQCGMCIPGIVTLMSALIHQGEIRSAADISPALVGSICRCSGYARIVDAVERVRAAHASALHKEGSS